MFSHPFFLSTTKNSLSMSNEKHITLPFVAKIYNNQLCLEIPLQTIINIISSSTINNTNNDSDPSLGFISFAHRLIEELTIKGRYRTAETYETTIRRFERYLNGNDIILHELDTTHLVDFEKHLSETGICLNSISYYMRNLRAIYNISVARELTPDKKPFRNVYTGVAKTNKRALTADTIKAIKNITLPPHSQQAFARDLFMFSFYTRGMAFIDIAFLKKSDLSNGILSYTRHKTKQKLQVRWEKPMQDIVQRHTNRNSQYLFPIINNQYEDPRYQYRNAAQRINYNLKKLGKMLNLNTPLTSYVARHSWASIAKAQNIPLSIISNALGHNTENTTRIYLTNLDNNNIDNANKHLIELL